MAVNGEEALRVAEARAANEAACKNAQSLVRWGLIIFAIGTGLWLLSYADWFPEALTRAFAGPPDQVGPRGGLLVIAGIGLAGAVHSYLHLRAHRLGTERARKQANAVETVSKWLGIAVLVVWIGAVLLMIALVIGNWLSGLSERFPFGAVHLFVMMLVLPLIAPVYSWIERQARTGLIFVLMALGMLLAVHVGWALLSLWQFVEEIGLPLWSASLLSIPALGVAGFLVLGIVFAARRLRAIGAADASAPGRDIGRGG